MSLRLLRWAVAVLAATGSWLTMHASAQSAAAPDAEPGVSHPLAVDRAARIAGLHYALTFALQPHTPTTAGEERLVFTYRKTSPEDLLLDFRDGTLESATLNGRPLPTTLHNGHLTLPASALHPGENTVETKFTANIAPAGKAITRYTDRDDGSEYLYTLFVPMDASMAFPCFDQPDLKAAFQLTLTAPSAWTLIGNTAPGPARDLGQGRARTEFPATHPISTYLFAFAAGPFRRIAPAAAGQPALFVRASQLQRAEAEAPQVQQMTARGIAFLTDYFAQPFPFPKYDLVLIPGFPFGGMEHAGATFLNEDGVLFRSAPTASDFFRRNILVLHETTHQWFGDLVTMRWFDDLWLKEGFAQYMAYKALAALEPASQPWKHFYEDIKPLAYGIDETAGTTPIYQNIPNLKDAKSAYGAIVYQKTPAVLKQLNFLLGEQNFRDGLRLYLKQHAYANAQWDDLIAAFEETGPDRERMLESGAIPVSPLNLWAQAWIKHRGMPEVEAHWSCAAGKLTALTLTQRDVLPDGFTWPIANNVLLGYRAQPGEVLRVNWNTASHPVSEAFGKPCPDFVFANAGDEAYGRFLLDPASETFVSARLRADAGDKQDPLLHTMLWGALWENVHVAKSPARAYATLALATLPAESDESLNRIQGGRVAITLHEYLSATARNALLPNAEVVIAARMLHAPTLDLRIVNFRTFTSIAETPAALQQIRSLLNGSLDVPGLKLQPLDRWNLVGHLIALNDPEAPAIYAAEQARDHTGEGQKYAWAVAAGTPSAAVKARYFAEYLHNPDRQEDWITQSLRPFNNWNQTGLTQPYLARALAALPEIKAHRKIFFLGAWLGAFMEGQHSAEAAAVVHAWLAQPGVDPDLRLKVLELSDELDRTVMIRARFAE